MTEHILGVLLAGGRSRRMGGGDKSLRNLGGQTILAHIIARLGPQVSRLVLNANGDPLRFAAFDLPVIADPIEGNVGPLVGVLAGMRAAGRIAGATHILTAPTDAPFLPDNLVAALESARDGHPVRIVLAASGGRTHPVCGLWPVALGDDLEAALHDGTRKVLDWTDRHDTVTSEFALTGAGVDPFFNTNRPEDLATAERLLADSGRDG
ncbi:MAG: molybdenum cofactor guanylyltransferase MobA [Pseudomonadota bacterium]